MISNTYDYTLPFKPKIKYTDLNHIQYIHANSLKILYCNARSIINKTEELQYIITQIQTNNQNRIPDLFAITEHWMNESSAKYFSFENYSTIFSSRSNKRGGGSAIFIHTDIEFETLSQYSDDENSITCVKIKTHTINTVVMCVYRAPNANTSKLNTFLQILQDHLTKVENESVYVVGDFNINILINDNATQSYISMMHTNAFFLCDNASVTRAASNTCLDHIHTNNIFQNMHIQYMSYDLFDHHMILIEIENRNTITKTLAKTTKTKTNQNKINEYIMINESQFLESNMKYDEFIDKISYIIKKNTRNIKKKCVRVYQKPWIDHQIIDLIKHKNFWYEKYKRDITNDNLKRELTYWRNQATYWKRRKKRDYFAKRFEETVSDNKKTWTCINEVLKNGKQTKAKLNIFEKNYTDEEKKIKINIFNDFFATIGKQMTDTFGLLQPPQKLPFRLNDPFRFKMTTENDIVTAIKKLKNTSAVGYDNIPTATIKQNVQSLKITIQKIINTSLSTGKVPENLKVSRITPIHKSGDTHNPSNYRPISILPIMDKILSKIVNEQIMDYIEKHHVLDNRQYGFRPSSNTSTALFDLVTNIQTQRDKQNIVTIIFIDLQKAFDTVVRHILLSKLWRTGIREKEHEWFSNYLSDRRQYINIEATESKLKIVEEGLPQGGNLASTLFLLYINDINELQLHGTAYMYADDIALVYSEANQPVMQNKLNEDMKTLQIWMEQQHLTLNTSKTKYLIVSHKKNIHFDIKYNNIIIEEVNNFKYLGVYLDNKMSWNIHLNYLIKKSSMMAGILRRISKACPFRAYKTIYYSLFHSHIVYGMIVWNSARKTLIHKLQIIQNKAIKNMFKHKRDENTKQIHIKHQLLPVQELIKCIQTSQIHNITHNYIHSNTILNTQKHTYPTRTALNIQQQHMRSKKMGTAATLNTSIINYNKLPSNLKNLNKTQFKINIKKYMFELFKSSV